MKIKILTSKQRNSQTKRNSPPQPRPSCANPEVQGPRSHKRHGKVAQLPRELREQINQMLDDGSSYPPIIRWLADHGHPGFNGSNLSAWKAGGFQDWLDHKDHITEMDGLRDLSLDIAERFRGTKMQQATLYVSAALFYKLLLK